MGLRVRARVREGAHRGRGGYSGSSAFNRERIGVAGFIPVNFGLFRASRGRRIHSRWLGFIQRA